MERFHAPAHLREHMLHSRAGARLLTVAGLLLFVQRMPACPFLVDLWLDVLGGEAVSIGAPEQALSAYTTQSPTSMSSSKAWLSCTLAGVMTALRMSLSFTSTFTWSLQPWCVSLFFFVQRASRSLCALTLELSCHDCGTSPALISALSSRLLRRLGTSAKLASTITPSCARACPCSLCKCARKVSNKLSKAFVLMSSSRKSRIV